MSEALAHLILYLVISAGSSLLVACTLAALLITVDWEPMLRCSLSGGYCEAWVENTPPEQVGMCFCEASPSLTYPSIFVYVLAWHMLTHPSSVHLNLKCQEGQSVVMMFQETLCPSTQIWDWDKQVPCWTPFPSTEILFLVYPFVDIISPLRIYLGFMWDDLSFDSPTSAPTPRHHLPRGYYDLGSGGTCPQGTQGALSASLSSSWPWFSAPWDVFYLFSASSVLPDAGSLGILQQEKI